ncbi:hypothetical protein MTP04_07340 [Lysinibacillus sp. PLM2]|nr:hypothetical protein MTP04_07340 [Lysinibacillus sp. PLM2]
MLSGQNVRLNGQKVWVWTKPGADRTKAVFGWTKHNAEQTKCMSEWTKSLGVDKIRC